MEHAAEFDGIYLSTTIPYVNAAPHVGFALELAQADALARGYRALGHAVLASTGTDDHSLKNARAAAQLGVPVQRLIADNARAFAELAAGIDARFDTHVGTSTDQRHRAAVERLFRACAANGDVYRRQYTGLYCVGCEAFYRADDLVAGACPEHGVPPETVEEENWFFRASRYASELLAAVDSGKLRILPGERHNEVAAFLRGGLDDFSLSRSAVRAHGFGIPVPGDPAQVIYVWFDALANYLSASGYARGEPACAWNSARRRLHVLGKGVLRFHAVYWPALLLSAGLPLPTELRVHGYLTVEGRKIGKSLGNGVDPAALIRDYGGTSLRYYLLRHVSPFKDADFSRERLIRSHDAELADDLGNLARRVLTLVRRHAAGCIPEPAAINDPEHALEALVSALPSKLRRCFDEHELAEGLGCVFEVVRAANRYLDHAAPWRLARAPEHEPSARSLRTTLAVSVGVLRALAVALEPFVPTLANELARSVGVSIRPAALCSSSPLHGLPVGLPVGPPPLLAPRLGA